MHRRSFIMMLVAFYIFVLSGCAPGNEENNEPDENLEYLEYLLEESGGIMEMGEEHYCMSTMIKPDTTEIFSEFNDLSQINLSCIEEGAPLLFARAEGGISLVVVQTTDPWGEYWSVGRKSFIRDIHNDEYSIQIDTILPRAFGMHVAIASDAQTNSTYIIHTTEDNEFKQPFKIDVPEAMQGVTPTLLRNDDSNVILFYQLDRDLYAYQYSLENEFLNQFQFSLPDNSAILSSIGIANENCFIYHGYSDRTEYIGCINMKNNEVLWESELSTTALSIWFDHRRSMTYICTEEGILRFPHRSVTLYYSKEEGYLGVHNTPGDSSCVLEFAGEINFDEGDVINLMVRNRHIFLMINDRVLIFPEPPIAIEAFNVQ